MRNPQSLMFEGIPGWSLQAFLWVAGRVHEFLPETKISIFLTGEAPEPKSDDPQVIYAHRKMLAGINAKMKNGHGKYLVYYSPATAHDFSVNAVWCYPTHLPEGRSADVARLAQLNGAIPVFNPIGPLATCVFAGVPLYGIPAIDPMVKVRYAYECIRLLSEPATQESIRVLMMAHAATVYAEKAVAA